MIPILQKICSVEGEKPFTLKIWLVWAAFLGTLALGLTVIDAPPAFLSSWLNDHPVFAQLDSAAGGWLHPGAMLLICGLIFLIKSGPR